MGSERGPAGSFRATRPLRSGPGWVIIRDIRGKGSLWLSPASVAANPPVAIDGVALEGGLRALLKLDPMRMMRFGYLGPKRGIFIRTKP